MTQLVLEQCFKCGVWFGLDEGHHRNIKRDKSTFFCPNGHSQVYIENEADRLRRERDQLQQKIAQKDDELREAAAELVRSQKKMRKLEKRTAAGTCPCCKRTFSNMARHMASEHPKFVADHTQKEIPPEDKVVPLRRGRRRA